MAQDKPLSDNERAALDLLRRKRAILVTQIPPKTSTGLLGETVLGMGVFGKLIARGLAYQTEEPVLEDGFQFTEAIELTEAGEALAQRLDSAMPTPRP